MSTRRRATPVPVLVAAALLLVGCATEEDPEPTGATGSAGSGTSSSAASSTTPGSEASGSDAGEDPNVPTFPSGVGSAEQAASADALVTVTDVRTGEHDGFDRVVFEVDGEGVPGWDVRYVDDPTQEGSGDPVDVAGAAVLQVLVSGVGYPFDTGVDPFVPDGPVPGPGAAVTEVVVGPTFEGVTQAFVGTAGESPFRVYLLEGPTRIVVEVAHPG
ncbi:hypothetical protein [Blastococcus sp. TF02A-26]|uniref:AMIN-like domain-containing (lipo)protein n=1 Tax=Blastococcus sp. TF02A-26 TaxID=2250577 RepID=UPI000DE88FEA|nr:hypothetical protein [Blastococcus sp. TF02A-26]RBY82655.1 hypothetical protein DQ240_18310 [Blastococcus sp. TF02A-26]